MPVEARSRRPALSHRLAPYILLLPAVALVLVAQGYPMLRQLVMSFQEFGLAQQFGQPAEWVWLDNYAAIISDPYFWTVLLKSLAFCLWTAGFTMVIGLGIALLMRAASSFASVVMNVVLIVVWAMPLIAALTVWQWLIDPNFGLVNYLLTGMGLSQFEGFSWLASSYWTFFIVASAVIVWASIPLVTISIFAALTQVDDAQIEAAELDGAGYLKRLQHVIFPTVAPVVSLMAVLQIIWDLRVFTQIHVLQQSGGISTETNLLGTYVYQVGISQGDYGVASALAMIILLVTLIITSKYIHMLWTRGEIQ
ncbi:sugar ABC transporter permease [Brachybacterium vulturis]|uniref:Sugar ABC transporter permease n=1 Tax=Brachybacterium vulturis TaxID=2017484 RepID=A0A291GHR2_9MICO|nr:sugar ABC transporter permease [Brachybacterium vulturis]ATG50083.1 sugar ABC transporter permease [Brachybacterium vulturis]